MVAKATHLRASIGLSRRTFFLVLPIARIVHINVGLSEFANVGYATIKNKQLLQAFTLA